ncbi:hypothetical protein INT45_011308 [Circinella minor]|uniref:Reverse transcriptase domain-containing protein n=1 Tax=Circinella minor TaxID=1195481 RepID=A0A8H7VJY9_9FUNG|nr:hypothetical protein INT45_011308 [Circinella minor]
MTINIPTPYIPIASLNCRSLKKTNSKKHQTFPHQIRSLSSKILALQETHAYNYFLQHSFDLALKTKSSTWTQHCGLISFDADLKIHPVWSSLDGRILHAKIFHHQDLFTPINVYVIYAPACRQQRPEFYNTLSALIPQQQQLQRSIILGDFNYNIHHTGPRTPNTGSWVRWLETDWHDPFQFEPLVFAQNTFFGHQGKSKIDFILVSGDLLPDTAYPQVNFVSLQTDHHAVSIGLRLFEPPSGLGVWRMNPYLARNSSFVRDFKEFLEAGIHRLPADQSAAYQWDFLKSRIKSFTQSYCRKQGAKKKQHMKSLHRSHKIFQQSLQQHQQHQADNNLNNDLHDDEFIHNTQQHIANVEQQIDEHLDHEGNILALRAGIRYREKGERSNKYFYNCLKTRQQRQIITSLRQSDGTLVRSTDGLLQRASEFYQQLYTADTVQFQDITNILAYVPTDVKLGEADRDQLTNEILDDELETCLKKLPFHSSPGIDGIPYAILKIIFDISAYRTLFLQVLNDALKFGQYPSTWQRSIITLLPKKGDLTDLKNWRPISLACADGKLFTKILANRFLSPCQQLINHHQTGFLRQRFIADNGLAARLTMDIAQKYNIPGIALLIDQQKAYDRVHPLYLRMVLFCFGFPTNLIDHLCSLFFNTTLCINVNGHISTPCNQERGLRQGDPLSPLLFNLALEPLLRAILASNSIQGFSFNSPRRVIPNVPDVITPKLKVLAYADDVLIFLSNPSELSVLLELLNLYGRASNAQLNKDKTVALSLSGKRQLPWIAALNRAGINVWNDEHNTNPVIKIWHSICILPVTKTYLTQIRSIVYQFVTKKVFPPVSFSTCSRPKKEGGVAILDPTVQHSALQLRWILPLIDYADDNHSFLLDIFRHCLKLFSGTKSAIYPILFSGCRSTPLTSFGCFFNFFRTIDTLDISIDWSQVNHSHIMDFPLCTIVVSQDRLPSNDLTRLLQKWKQVKIKDGYYLRYPEGRLQEQPIGFRSRHRHLITDFFRRRDQGHFSIRPEFISLTSRTGTAEMPSDTSDIIKSTLSDGLPIINLTSKEYRQRFRPALHQLSELYPRETQATWSRFWRSSFIHRSHTIWWRALHNKISCRDRLHRIIPQFCQSPLCIFCDQLDTQDHFLWGCRIKQQVWQIIANLFLQQPEQLTYEHIKSLSTAPLLLKQGLHLDFATLIATTILSIWDGNWGWVFRQENFWPPRIAAIATLRLRKIECENRNNHTHNS